VLAHIYRESEAWPRAEAAPNAGIIPSRFPKSSIDEALLQIEVAARSIGN
jgi:hypothetical protein